LAGGDDRVEAGFDGGITEDEGKALGEVHEACVANHIKRRQAEGVAE
jgi:hypothetical protein